MPSPGQPSVETGPGTTGPAGRAAQVLDRARTALLQDPTGTRDLRPVEAACLDVTSAHPSGQAHLLASGRQKLSGLVRDPDARVAALAQLRRFREVVGSLEDRGHTAGHLVAGVVVLPDGGEMPVLLRSCRVGGSGETDAQVVVEGQVELNPALARELLERSGGTVDLPAVLGDRLRTSGNGFDPYPLLDLVQAALPGVPGALLRRRLLLAPVSLDGDRVLADLERLRTTVGPSSPLAWVGDEQDEPVEDLLARVGHGLPVVDDPGQGVQDLLERFSPVRLDPDQRRVLTAVLAGHSTAVDAPPGAGATTCATAVAAVAAATGRRCLVVVPTRAEGDVLVDRLVALGLGDLVSDGSGRPAASTESAARTAGSTGGPAEEAARRHVEAGERYRAAVAELRRVRRPWQVTRAQVLEVLAEAAVEGPRLSDVVLAQDPGTGLSREQMEALADDLAEAVALGSLEPTETAWTGARITDRQGAQEALGLSARLRDGLVAEAVDAAAELAQGTGTVRATTVAEVAERHRLFAGLQTTLDRLVPEVFDVPILDLVAATADEEFRRTTGYTLGGAQRWRLRRRARQLVRPGVECDERQLHRLLSAAAAQRLDWQKISEGSGWAHLPSSTAGLVATLGELVRACERLDLLHPGLQLSRRPVGQVEQVAARLLEEADALDDLPRRTLLEQRVSERGGSGLLAHLRRLPTGTVSPGAAARELRLAWWTGVAEATAPALSDRAVTSEASERYAASQRDWVAAAPARVRAARGEVDSGSRLAGPVRVLVPADVAALPVDDHVDVLVLDDAGRAGFPEACGALARSSQVLALGDLGVARQGSALAVLGSCLPVDRLRTGHRTHQPALAGLPAVTGSTPVRSTGSPAAEPAVTWNLVEDAVGLPEGDADQVDSTEVEVDRVVRETLRLVAELAAQDPPRSVAVVALTRAHALAVAGGVRRAVRAYPSLAVAFSSAMPEPVVVASVDQTRGLERDEVLLTTGFARTPHGRVLHRFGPLDAPGGAGLMTTAVSRARHRLHVVTALRARDLDPSRLKTPGAVSLARTLAAVEQAAGQRRPGRGGDTRPVRDAAPVRGTSPSPDAGALPAPHPRSAVLQVLAQEIEALGAHVTAGPGGGLAVARPPHDPWLVVDVDVDHPDPALLVGRRAGLAEAGWEHRLVAAELVAADVAGVALGLVGPRPDDAEAFDGDIVGSDSATATAGGTPGGAPAPDETPAGDGLDRASSGAVQVAADPSDDGAQHDAATPAPGDSGASTKGASIGVASSDGASSDGARGNGADTAGAVGAGVDSAGADSAGADTSGADTSGADTSGADTAGATGAEVDDADTAVVPGTAPDDGTTGEPLDQDPAPGGSAAPRDSGTAGPVQVVDLRGDSGNPRQAGAPSTTGPTPPTHVPSRAGLRGEPVVPGVSSDDTDLGWGGRPDGDDDDRILRERPPHW
ncbi:hypothetical protein ACFQL5_02085 [Aquipuribacter hungaricus]|uniref:hypothetical protein n=1 Tax=Aquipuribacter hungaricus TaxID=545624 RepID=UPI00362230A3